MKRKIFPYLWAVLFILSMTVLTTGVTANAANQKAVKSVTVRADKKNITKKTYALEIEKSKSLKVSASPKRAVRSIRYKSNKPEIVAVTKKGKVTAKKKGTAKIQITVTGKNKKKRSTWVKIKAENPAIKSVSVMIDNRNVTGKEYSLTQGGWKDLKVNAAPAKAVKSIQYASSNTRVANVDQKGTVVARNAGTARITVTAMNKDNEQKSAWVTIKVTESKPDPQPDPTPAPGENKILVAYFSATNTTEKIAGYIADELPADLYEIVPEIPYTSADLNYGDSSSRTSIEMNDPNARPAISGSVENMGQYETVFLGFPIWWGKAPRIISTFLESYDFTGKTIIPFCTSASSGIGSSAKNLHNLTNGAKWHDGRRFGGSASRSNVAAWAKNIDLDSAVIPEPEPKPDPEPAPEPGTSNILIAYFSRVGNTEYPDDVDATTSASIVVDDTEQYGTTEYLARIIQQKVGGALHRIETKETYPTDFDEVVDQNHTEMGNGTLPELKESDIDISKYDTVFIGYPVWATNAPQAVLSFLHKYDLSGKKVIPFCTHDGYGAGSSYRTIGNACPRATILDGLAVRAADVSTAEDAKTDRNCGNQPTEGNSSTCRMRRLSANSMLKSGAYTIITASQGMCRCWINFTPL